MTMARIIRSNRLPDSLPVVLRILEAHGEGITIPALQAEIEAGGFWGDPAQLAHRAIYFRIYGVIKTLHGKGIIRMVEGEGREARWVLDREEYARQRRKELSEMLGPFVDGCLMVTDPEQFVEEVQEMIRDGSLEAMLAERRARGRR